MADPTAIVPVEAYANGGYSKVKLLAAEEIVVGALVAENQSTGEARNLADEAGAWPCGTVEGVENGENTVPIVGTALDTEADKGVVVRGGYVRTHSATKPCNVTGVASYADKGKWVYATDGQTMTLTRPADDAIPCGFVFDKSRASTDTSCDVYLFSKEQSAMLSYSGGPIKPLMLGNVPLGTSAAAQITGLPLRGHGKIVGGRAIVLTPPTNDTKITTVNFEINGTDTTGGVITLDADLIQTKGAVVEASAFTALNEYHDGDVLDMESATSGTHLADGVFAFVLDLEPLPGA